jgi:hypothetical protein
MIFVATDANALAEAFTEEKAHALAMAIRWLLTVLMLVPSTKTDARAFPKPSDPASETASLKATADALATTSRSVRAVPWEHIGDIFETELQYARTSVKDWASTAAYESATALELAKAYDVDAASSLIRSETVFKSPTLVTSTVTLPFA